MKKYVHLSIIAVLATALFGCGVKVNPFNQSANINPFSQSMSDKLAEEAGNDLAEKIIEGDSGADVEIAAEGDSVAWPKGVPSDVPEFKYGKIDITFDDKNSTDAGAGVMIQISNVEKGGFEKYLTDLKTAGFVVNEEFTIVGDMSNQVLEKDNIRVTFTSNPIGDNTAWILVEKLLEEGE